ncbi:MULTISPECIES: allophanate hydrolase [unclassified Rhodococcus (in: high G+C Gram-positive bacteria)]|uniref:allophanate hydrolase n=1 Tax=unclassified Rhodococcus (in: high G+C Gram-positive bacteria) TaxID=192944 RepID=UPI0009296541|nr:allophanate hydrolase [Rhodococcus sp. M8]OLL17139.1 allophanate hydrolase [Rhodococcus sp. M8]QPG47211.1 allophanate hydrolase [Rhodococcus sp. M8]
MSIVVENGLSAAPSSSRARAEAALRRLGEVDRPEVWIALRPAADVLADADAVDARVAAGEDLPLAGLLVAVKDNVDVAGLPTTAGCPEFAYTPTDTASGVARLVDAGAVILGKTNLDQFATGLVGTRSPYGAVRCSWDPERVSGGSSSGSATAVALGIADIGIGTDTAGSGRVPAALQGLVGIKATLGVIPAHGVVPACVDYDCLTVFATSLDLAVTAAKVMAGPEPRDPRSRRWPSDVPFAAPSTPRVAVPRAEDLVELCDEYREAFARTVAAGRAAGLDVTEVDVSPLLDAATLLYDGAVVAQRYAAVGEFLATNPAGADPTVAAIVAAAERPAAHELVADLDTLTQAKAFAADLLDGFAGLLLPTTTEHPTIAAVQSDPIGINRRMGTFTNFCNLLDMAAVAVPGASTAEGHPFGVMVVVPAFADQVAVDLAARLTGVAAPGFASGGVELAVFGAHLRDQPLHFQLEEIGARFVEGVHTSDAYRLTALNTTPPKPGLVRHGAGRGAPIAGEVFRVSEAGLGRFLAALPAPMTLTSVELSDGRWVVGFGCTHDAAADAVDITEFGGWVAYRTR